VLWDPAFFGVKPAMVIKSGSILAVPMGDPNASIPTPQPVHMRTMFAGYGRAMTQSAVTFVSGAALDTGDPAGELGLSRQLLPVANTRRLTKADMVLNDKTPDMQVDSETYEVRADGELLTCEPAAELGLAQRYYLF